MNWLHFCDFHIGGARAPQANALKTLLETVSRVCEKNAKSIDAVFLVGDLAYSGKKEQYDRFRDDFYLPLMRIPSVAKALVFAVPGNHDVNCDLGVPITWDTIQKKRQDIFFAEDDDGRRMRKHRAELFDDYLQFVTDNKILSPNPQVEVSHLYEASQLPVSILATNTAFFSDETENKRPKSTPIPLASIRHLIKSEPPNKPLLIIGHHSPDSFRPDHFKLLKPLLYEKKAFYLHGHDHDPGAAFNGDNTLRSLGFGATYLQSLETEAEGAYVNSFTHCTLAERLLVTAFSWERGNWRDTTSLQFSDCELITKTPFERIAISLPSIKESSSRIVTEVPLSKVPRAHPEPSAIVPIAAPNTQLWLQLVQMSDNIRQLTQEGAFTVTELPEKDGKWYASLEVESARHLLVCVPGGNHVLSAKEVEALNTKLDTEGFSSVTVISLGMISDDARSMYLRLQNRKQMEILVNVELAAHSDRILSVEQKRHIQGLDAAMASVRLLVTEDNVYCLVTVGIGARAAFYLMGRDGTT